MTIMDSAELPITLGGKDRVLQAADVLAPSFKDDPVLRYFINHMEENARQQYLNRLFRGLFTAATLNGGVIAELDDWACCAIMLPPGKKVDNPLTYIPAGIISILFQIGIGSTMRLALEYPGLADAAKAKVIKKNEKYYYVFFIATKEDCRNRGLTSKLIKHYQSIAAKEGVPIWLEATTPHSARIYSKLGFETVEEFRLGKGRADAEGRKKKDGEGVPVVAMLWTPPAQKSDEQS